MDFPSLPDPAWRPKPTGLDLPTLAKLRGDIGDDGVLRRFAHAYLTALPDRIDDVERGLHNGESGRVRHAVRGISAAGSMFGLVMLAQRCADIESVLDACASGMLSDHVSERLMADTRAAAMVALLTLPRALDSLSNGYASSR
jgi:hypothetical protein